jgi:hypothetical protein
MDFNGNSEVIRALKSKLASAYPGFVYVRVVCMGGEAKRYGLAYMRTGLLAAGEVDVPVRLWSFYRDVEEFFTAVVGEGRCTLVV